MSSSLQWEIRNPKTGTFSHEFKCAIRKLYDGGHIEVEVNRDTRSFLQGMLAGTDSEEVKNDIEHLLELIEENGSVHLKEVY